MVSPLANPSTSKSNRLGLAAMGETKAEKSLLMAAVRRKAGTWVPEAKLLLSVSAAAGAPQSEGIVLNSAVPKVADAFMLENGTGVMLGSVVTVLPKSL